jgi:predicted MFS family arabinose efflux permease
MQRRYHALQAIFFANGAGLASWVPHIPTAQGRLGIGTAALGLALLAMGLGSLVTMPLAGLLISRIGSRAVVRMSLPAFLVALPLPLLAPSLATLGAALFLLGASTGALDVAMNAQAVALEALSPRPFLSRLHALWSFGGMAGSALTGIALRAGMTPDRHLLTATACLAIAALPTLAWLLPPEHERRAEPAGLARPAGALLGLGALAFLALLAEGSMADWSALYFRATLSSTPAFAAAGFATFSMAMAVGRWVGDGLSIRFGEDILVRSSAWLAALGFGAALLVNRPWAGLMGCACMGLGLANVVPILFRAAGRVPGFPAGRGIAAMTTAGYRGFLIGPPVIGLVAEWTALPMALGLVVLSAVVIALSSAIVRPLPAAAAPRS